MVDLVTQNYIYTLFIRVFEMSAPISKNIRNFLQQDQDKKNLFYEYLESRLVPLEIPGFEAGTCWLFFETNDDMIKYKQFYLSKLPYREEPKIRYFGIGNLYPTAGIGIEFDRNLCYRLHISRDGNAGNYQYHKFSEKNIDGSQLTTDSIISETQFFIEVETFLKYITENLSFDHLQTLLLGTQNAAIKKN